MKKEDFIFKLADYCEFECVNLDVNTKFKDLEGFDSLSMLSITAFCDEYFNVCVTTNQIKELQDMKSLINLIGEDNFE